MWARTNKQRASPLCSIPYLVIVLPPETGDQPPHSRRLGPSSFISWNIPVYKQMKKIKKTTIQLFETFLFQHLNKPRIGHHDFKRDRPVRVVGVGHRPFDFNVHVRAVEGVGGDGVGEVPEGHAFASNSLSGREPRTVAGRDIAA